MATIKVFDANGVKELSCFDTLSSVPYLLEDEDVESAEEQNFEAADDSVDF